MAKKNGFGDIFSMKDVEDLAGVTLNDLKIILKIIKLCKTIDNKSYKESLDKALKEIQKDFNKTRSSSNIPA